MLPQETPDTCVHFRANQSTTPLAGSDESSPSCDPKIVQTAADLMTPGMSSKFMAESSIQNVTNLPLSLKVKHLRRNKKKDIKQNNFAKMEP